MIKATNDNKTEFEMWRKRQAERQAYVLARRLDRARFNQAWLRMGAIKRGEGM